MNCLVWDVDPIFHLWGHPFRWYGILFGLGIIVGHALLAWQFQRGGHDKRVDVRLAWTLALGMAVGAFVGHRLFYEWDRVLADPWGAFVINGPVSGLSSHGAAVGILLGLLVFHRFSRIPFLELGDRMVFGVTATASFVRLGNLMNSEIVGAPTQQPWAFCFIRHDGGHLIGRHPVQLYEFAMGVAVLAILWIVDRFASGEKRPQGLMLGVFALSYFSLRFGVEFFKARMAVTNDFPLSMGQMLSIPFILAGLFLTRRAWATGKDQVPS